MGKLHRLQKYPKNDFDALFIQIKWDLEKLNIKELAHTINFQKFLQCQKIFHHKLSVMKIDPRFSDRSWYENNYDDLALIPYKVSCSSEENNERLIKVESHSLENLIFKSNISLEMYRTLKNNEELYFIVYNGNVIDFLPIPDDSDIADYDRYNFVKNLAGEQMRLLRILYSQIEKDVDSNWPQYDNDKETLLKNAIVYQNKLYDYASDNTVSLLTENDIERFFKVVSQDIDDSLLLPLNIKLVTAFGKVSLEITHLQNEDIKYKVRIKKAFVNVFKNVDQIVFCFKEFEVCRIIPLYL